MSTVRILLADDQPAVRSALRLLLDQQPGLQVVGEAAMADDLLAQVTDLRPDLVLLDWELPGLQETSFSPAVKWIRGRGSRLWRLHALRDLSPHLLVIVLSGRPEVRAAALDAGADAFVSKGDPPDQLLVAMRAVGLRNGRWSNGTRSPWSDHRAYIIPGGVSMKQELVKDWMTRNVVTVSPNTTLPEAHRLMSDRRIRRLPVVKSGRLVGIVTRGDIRGAEPSGATSLSIWELNYLLAKLKIKEIMTRTPVTIPQQATIGEAARLMLENKISGLPVVDSTGNLVGIITESDIFRMVVLEWNRTWEA